MNSTRRTSSSAKTSSPSDGGAASQSGLEERFVLGNVVGASGAMFKVIDQARRAALEDCPVLVAGEPGTGKEWIAEAIHQNGRRNRKPFVVARLNTLPLSRLESELFGERQSGPSNNAIGRAGRFAEAHGGTLYIDEISRLGGSCQALLLEALEASENAADNGSGHEAAIDVRLIAATTQDLDKLVSVGAFNEELYCRLRVISIHLPPLRQRRAEIPALTRRFLNEFCAANGKPTIYPDDQLVRFLESYDWPGNMRQLRKCLEQMVISAVSDTLSVDDLPPAICEDQDQFAGGPAGGQAGTLAELERRAVLKAMKEHGNNRKRAAESLGISVRTLQRKLKKWDL